MGDIYGLISYKNKRSKPDMIISQSVGSLFTSFPFNYLSPVSEVL
mgnify:FL=1